MTNNGGPAPLFFADNCANIKGPSHLIPGESPRWRGMGCCDGGSHPPRYFSRALDQALHKDCAWGKRDEVVDSVGSYLFALWSVGSRRVYVCGLHPRFSASSRADPDGNSTEGASTAEIGDLLKENGLIRKSWFFAPYVWWKGYARKLQAGVYEIPPGGRS